MFNVKKDRAAGILLHPTSLPGAYGIGEIGAAAMAFVDKLAEAGMRLWQVLPLGPTGFGDSPYQSFSTFAGNHYLICLETLKQEGLLTNIGAPPHEPKKIDFGTLIPWKMGILRQAYENFTPCDVFRKFCRANAAWLADYALFCALKNAHDGAPWTMWDAALVKREEKALAAARQAHAHEIEFHKFLQYIFFTQWAAVKKYANSKKIQIIGDIPIFVASDSADVWAAPQLYKLDKHSRSTAVAGVPPDYFSKTGQLWGNPLYNWAVHKRTGYQWWINRVKATFKLFDIVRVDHFRGFEAYWAVPAREKTAKRGKWLPGPGKFLFAALEKKLGTLRIIAEDLGEITPAVDGLRTSLGLPGMRVLQFGMQPDAKSTHLPVNFDDALTVCYTGTHDNDTTHGWYAAAPEAERDYTRRYMNISGDDIAWDMLRLAFSTPAMFAIAPLQDVLSLGSEARMNCPGTSGWWHWRFTADMLTDEHTKKLRYMAELFGRA